MAKQASRIPNPLALNMYLLGYNSRKKLVSVNLSRETSVQGKIEQEKTLDMLSELILRVLNQIKVN